MTKERIKIKNSQVKFTHLKCDYVFDLKADVSTWTYLNFRSFKVKFDVDAYGNLNNNSVFLFDDEDNFVCSAELRNTIAFNPDERTTLEDELVKATRESKRQLRAFHKRRETELEKSLVQKYGEEISAVNYLTATTKEEEKSAEDVQYITYLREVNGISSEDINRVRGKVVPIESVSDGGLQVVDKSESSYENDSSVDDEVPIVKVDKYESWRS
jgi:predicted house-cleaning noncanonical NTP pyrophosphatase (MazG superfamily)